MAQPQNLPVFQYPKFISIALIKYPDQKEKQLRGERAYFNSQFQAVVYENREVKEHKMANDIISVV